MPVSAAAQDAARFFAGMEGRADGPFRELEKEKAWTWHRKESNAMWARADKEQFPALRAFQQKEIAGKEFSRGTVFYPFGGPDIFTACTLFPNNNTYVLVGLEPPGTVPDLAAVKSAKLEKYLARVRLMMDSLPRRSFFITANMDHQVRGQISDGLALPLLMQLARLNAEIIGHAAVTVDKDGKVIPRKEERQAPSSLRNDGIAVDFKLPGDAAARHLLYFSVNLHDSHLPSNATFLAFLKGLRPYTAFFKSASYLPHQKGFASIRQEVLENGGAIVQDDTGIPYRFIDQAVWNVKLYGAYTQPYGSYKYLVQQDLKKAYDEGKATPLDFYIGYGYRKAPSSLLVFSKKKS
ncbi:MAG: hypothetical protein HY820_06360 [Acidobacteria bacterium]|nr:hypothetical protein [Acidobacteriota bacterium]